MKKLLSLMFVVMVGLVAVEASFGYPKQVSSPKHGNSSHARPTQTNGNIHQPKK